MKRGRERESSFYQGKKKDPPIQQEKRNPHTRATSRLEQALPHGPQKEPSPLTAGLGLLACIMVCEVKRQRQCQETSANS